MQLSCARAAALFEATDASSQKGGPAATFDDDNSPPAMNSDFR
jgi:hypothetical protein